MDQGGVDGRFGEWEVVEGPLDVSAPERIIGDLQRA